MPIRVAQIGTGNVGGHALKALITNPAYELTAVWVSSESKAGKDAAELIGLDTVTGIKATTDLDEVLATTPDCAVYTAMADNRLAEALEDYRRILAAGVNVVGSGPVFLQWPWQVIPDEMVAPIEDAARQGKSSLFVNGIDPGFANDLIPLALTGTCQSIQQVRCMEIVNYATYDSATVMFDVMGFGKPMDEIPILLQPGVLSIGWGSVVRQIAAGLGVELDGLEEIYVREPAPESFDIASGHIAKGTVPRPWFSNTSPDCATTCARIGRNPPRWAATTGSRSPANPATPWICACRVPTGTTTTPGCWRPPCGWSTPSRPSSPPSRVSARP